MLHAHPSISIAIASIEFCIVFERHTAQIGCRAVTDQTHSVTTLVPAAAISAMDLGQPGETARVYIQYDVPV